MSRSVDGAASGAGPTAAEWQRLFRDHVREMEVVCERALEYSAAAGEGFDGVVFHAGSPVFYHRDDQLMPFRTSAHFARWGAIPGANHLLAQVPGRRARLVRVVPDDYWYGAPPPGPFDELLDDIYDVSEVPSLEAAAGEITALGAMAYIGNAADFASGAGFPERGLDPGALVASLDWDRAIKTDYEIECIRAAARRAGLGHAAVRILAEDGASERQLHAAYLEASVQLESETPYPNIIAWNEASAVLHYEERRPETPAEARCLLIDAGASVHGYASDISRTYALRDAPSVFVELLEGMERLQADLVESVRPGSYVAVHEQAARGACELLREAGVLRIEAEEALEGGFDRCFFPHGVGHHLGLQVHDVGGVQHSPAGETVEPPVGSPALRTTRPLAERHVVTIEPGLYFIPLLLAPLRGSAAGKQVDWSLVDELTPCGGIRVEDDVVVTAEGCENLSRPFVPGATGA